MFKYSLTTLVASIVIAALAVAIPAKASIIETDSVSTSNAGAFDSQIKADDLINTGRATLASKAGGVGNVYFYTDSTGTNDGSTAVNTGSVDPATTTWQANANSYTYTLNTNPVTGGSATGYDITAVHVIDGWAYTHFNWQNWHLEIATLSHPAFQQVGPTVNYQPATASATMVSLDGDIGTGVTAIRYVGESNGQTGQDNTSVLHEIDVLGAATPVPEPASLGLLAAGGVLILRRRRA